MLELGPISSEEHQKIADYLKNQQIQVILVGNEFNTASSSFQKFTAVSELIASGLLATLKDQLILIKGSRGIKLELVIPEL